MNPILANAFPVAGVWLYLFMAVVALVLLPLFPLILRRRRRREQQELHEKIEKARADILEDGIVEGPKGDYVPHRGPGWDRSALSNLPPSGRTGPPKQNAYHGGPWV